MKIPHPLILSGALLVFCGVVSVAYRVIAEDTVSKKVNLSVPIITQAPGGNWSNPWGNACEEASVAMVEAFYAQKKITQSQANDEMRRFFGWENEIFGYNLDTGAEDIVRLIQATSSFKGVVVDYPALSDIKKELQQQHPVIALVNQFDFYQKTPSKQPGSSFHVFVIVGYDEGKQQFVVNDPANLSVRWYSYDRVMNALHDLGPEGEATGNPVVVFTSKDDSQ